MANTSLRRLAAAASVEKVLHLASGSVALGALTSHNGGGCSEVTDVRCKEKSRKDLDRVYVVQIAKVPYWQDWNW